MRRFVLVVLGVGGLLLSAPALAQTDTTFTYQGALTDTGEAADGVYDISVSLWDAAVGGGQLGPTLSFDDVQVTDGLFTLDLDFGAVVFDGSQQWIEIAVNRTTLSPRQPVTRSPYAIQTRGIFVDDDERVGIGTDVPAVPLHVSGDGLVMQRISGSSPLGSWLDLQNTFTGGQTWSLVSSGVDNDGGAGNLLIYAQDTGQTAATIRNSGFVGFGTPSPKGRIHNAGDYYGLGHVWLHAFEGDGENGTAYIQARDDSGASDIGLTIRTQEDGLFRDAIQVLPDGVARFNYGIVATEPCAVFSDSSVATVFARHLGTYDGIGTKVGVWGQSDAPGDAVGVLGRATADSGGFSAGVRGDCANVSGYDFWAGGAGINYGSPSSVRWKRNIGAIADPLALLAEIRGVRFDWDEAHGGQRDIGFIGEEVGRTLPEVVAYEEGSEFVTGMDYSKMTPVLVEAVKALNEKHEAEIARKDAQIAKLAERLARLEAFVERKETP